MNTIEDIKFQNAVNFSKKEKKEGIVLLGAGGDLNEWIDGVSDILLNENIATGSKETMWQNTFYKLTTTGGRTDLLMVFNDKHTLNIGKMAIWRLKFGDCSWLSDYIVNYKNHFLKGRTERKQQ